MDMMDFFNMTNIGSPLYQVDQMTKTYMRNEEMNESSSHRDENENRDND